MIQWLLSLTKERSSRDQNEHIILACDNMCNLAKLKIARTPLPFQPPLDRLWLDVKNVIDVFYFRNHISSECQRLFSPAKLKEEYPDFNTQAGEQTVTFVWVHLFAHIICSINKVHHLFYLHRMVLRRNAYTSKCYRKEASFFPRVTTDTNANAVYMYVTLISIHTYTTYPPY